MSTYFTDRYQGVGAIAAAAPAPRSAPAPSVRPQFARDARQGDPMLNLGRQTRRYGRRRVLPGVFVVGETIARPDVLLSGVRRGAVPGGRSDLGRINTGDGTDTPGGTGGGGRPPKPQPRLGIRAQTAGMKYGAYVPPVAPIGTSVSITPLVVRSSGISGGGTVSGSTSGAGLTRSPNSPHVQTYPAPTIGTGIGQQSGTVLSSQPAPWTGGAMIDPTAQVGGGVAISPTTEEYEPIDVGPQTEPGGILTYPAPPAPRLNTTGKLLLVGGGALALYFLFLRKKRR